MLFIDFLTLLLLPLKLYHNAMYRKFIVILFLLITFAGFTQDSQLAYRYYIKGEYEKAALLYKGLYEQNKIRRDYFKQLLSCYQLTENFDAANTLLANHQKQFPKQSNLLVEIGYNLQLQDQAEAAKTYYEQALNYVEENPFSGYLIGRSFQDNHLLDYALKAYKKAMELNPDLNYDAYIAFIYGEKAEIENMFETYLTMVAKNENYYETVQRYAGKFLTDDNLNENNIIFRKLLLKKLQQQPNDAWNKLLSWLFMQQRDYDKALVQEIALYKRNPEDLIRISELGALAFDYKDYEAAKAAFDYILENSHNPDEVLDANLYLLRIDQDTAETSKEVEHVDQKFQELLSIYGDKVELSDLETAYADFLTFKKDEPQKAISILKDALQNASSDFDKASIKLKLADVLVYTDKFNEALIYYSQIQTNLKNSVLAQQARYKVAQTSYFKGDFKWAMTQLKVLKKSTSQLIANDALELHLLISDHSIGDSISTAALKSYAKADVLAYQNKNKQAIDTLSTIIEKYEGRSIEDEALFKQAELLTRIKKYDDAINNYLKVIDYQKDGILVDNAYYQLGLLYENQLGDLEKAKEMYQKIIFEFPSSIYLVDARKRFRKLRGDIVN